MTTGRHPDSDYQSNIRRISIIGLIGNIFLFTIKLLLGIFGRSQALTADAFHSLSDFTTDISIIFGVKLWSKPPDERHPYGHRRIETVITLIICAVLITAGLSLGYNAILSLKGEPESPPRFMALVGALVSIIAKEILFRWTLKTGKKEKSKAVIANAWHHRTDALSSLPVGIAILVTLINEELAFLDQVTALGVSFFILYAAYKLIKPSLLEIIGTGFSEKNKKLIRSLTLSIKEVKSVHAIRSRQMGSGWFVDLHIQVDAHMTVEKGHRVAESVKNRLLKKGPDILDVVVHIEPYRE
jgi:cation diffusion facilitator family transporter